MMRAILAILLLTLICLPSTTADTYCSASVPCAIGCCGHNNVCGLGPDYCAPENCINNCNAKSECNPGNWPEQYTNATTCPLNVCCSEYGFCGTTSDFCGNSTVSRPSCDVNSASISRVVGYYNLAAIARSCGGMSPESIPQGIYTHIYAAFGSISPGTFEVVPGSSGDEQLYQLLEALQIRDLGQQLWISIGGWDFSNSDAPTATTFSDLAAADTTQQNAFFNSLILFMNTWGFTGVDIDWEYPAADDRNGQPSDYSNYPIFLANLKKALSEYHFGLSITLPTSYWYLQHFDLVSIEPSVDWFNYMSYDLHGTWDVGSKWTGAYLNAHTNLTEIESALDLLWRNNITASKINMGVAFYGRSFTLADSSCSEPGCAYLSAGDAGDCSNTAGILFNSEIAEIISENGITPVLDTDAAVKSVTWNGDQWVSFDDQDTWKLKADFAKSECLGGVLVWSVDNDDTNQTFARGLAAALGNPLNLDPKTGLTVEVMEFSTTASLSTQGNYCKFINCGEVCPNGYTTIIRGDESSQLMLDSTECPRGNSQTQTLCCPSSTNVPTCQWRGFHNSGKCQGGCLDGEAEVGTISAGCSSGYQSACCTITESTTPWSQCQWTSSCESDNTCPSGYPTFVVGSRDGWGGRPSCDGGYNYNYCCSTSSVPDAFTNCDWYGHEVSFSYAQYCSDSCPSNSIRIAEQSVFGIYLPAYSSNCYLGNEAFCCSGAPAKLSVPRGIGPPRDSTALQFDAYLSAFLANPVCVDTWESNYGSIFYKRALNKRSTALDQKSFSSLVSYIVMLATSSYPRTDLRSIWDQRLAQFGYQGTAPNSTYLSQAVYASWDGSYVYDTPGSDPSGLVADMLCNIAHSVNGTESVQLAEEALCEIDDGSSSLTKRMIDGINMNDRSDNGDYPTVFAVLNGALSVSQEPSLSIFLWSSISVTDCPIFFFD